jgi:DNA mismatch endonuclease, patch repair protein
MSTDAFTKSQRSEIMKHIRSSGNKTTEQRLITIFKKANIHGWRRHYDVKGHPDFVFLCTKTAVFVDGCFWHGHNCRNVLPKQNADFWNKKRAYNLEHDINITKYFLKRGWTVIRIWECELKPQNKRKLSFKLKKISR